MSRFYCSPCGLAFADQHDLDSHTDASIHYFRCPYCGVECRGRFQVDQHILFYHRDNLPQPIAPSPLASVRCTACAGEFNTQRDLDQHIAAAHQAAHPRMQYNSDPPPRLINCAECHLRFYTQESLDHHSSTAHPAAPVAWQYNGIPPPPPLTPCGKCHLKFFTQQSLNEHQTAFHPVPPTPVVIPCRQCHLRFLDQPSLDWHVYDTHQTPNAHQQISAVPPPESIPNRRRHGEAANDRSLDQRAAVARAAAPRGRQPVKCSICHKGFMTRMALAQHMVSRVHAGFENQAPVFQCEECGRKFEEKDMLTLHAVSHVTQRWRG